MQIYYRGQEIVGAAPFHYGDVAKLREVPDKGNGMIVTEGGFGLYLLDGKPTFIYNFLGVDRPTFAANNPLPKGKTRSVVNFSYDGGGRGKEALSR